MSRSLVGVVIPLYNKRETINRTINSVLRQTYQDFEVVIIDDGSTDGSTDAIHQQADKRIRIIRQANGGPGHARNNGARALDTPLIAFLDADDEWRSDFLERAVHALEDHPGCAAFICGYDSGEYRKVRPNYIAALGLSGETKITGDRTGVEIKSIIDGCHSSCIVIRRNDLFEQGGFFDAWRCVYGEDSILWLRMLLSKTLFFCPDELTIFHVEDSVFGYAAEQQERARPIVSDAAQLRREFTSESSRDILERVLPVFLELDLRNLARSGAFREAARIRAIHDLPRLQGVLIDALRFIKSKLRSASKI